MKKLLCILLVFGLMSSCTQNRPDKNCETFTELSDPTNDTLSDWSKTIRQELMASFVSIDKKYPKSVMPDLSRAMVGEKVIGWKGEKLSAQLLLWTPVDVKQVEFEFSDFKSVDGALPASIAQARFVRYVMTDEFAEGCGERKPENYASSLAPDMLDNLECFDIEAKTVRPVWITVEIPRSAKEGLYKGKIQLFAKNQSTQEFDLEIEVLNQTLPEPSAWKIHLDQWQHPSAVARTAGLEVWSDAHFEKMKPLFKMLADAGQKVITANVNKDPWNNQCFDAYEDMITWTKGADGSWKYDYTIFDKWVQFMMDLGVKKMINCYSMVPWNNELHYIDGKSGAIIDVKADPGTKVFVDMWAPFLTDFTKHLEAKGWLEITNIAMDERNPKDMEETLKVLKKYAPELGIALADNHKSYKKYPFIKDMCVGAEFPVDLADIEDRRNRGLVTTYYVCCAHEFPNQFTFSDSGESAYIGWFTEANNFDGFLRWAFNSWVENPLTDSRFKTWPAGDTYIVYPDARSSIRYERFVEGIQDFEKIQIIKHQLAEKGTEEAKAKLLKLQNAISKLKTVDRTATWNDDLNRAKEILVECAR